MNNTILLFASLQVSGQTALFLAVVKDDIDYNLVTKMLKRGANPNSQDNVRVLLLHYYKIGIIGTHTKYRHYEA